MSRKLSFTIVAVLLLLLTIGLGGLTYDRWAYENFSVRCVTSRTNTTCTLTERKVAHWLPGNEYAERQIGSAELERLSSEVKVVNTRQLISGGSVTVCYFQDRQEAP